MSFFSDKVSHEQVAEFKKEAGQAFWLSPSAWVVSTAARQDQAEARMNTEKSSLHSVQC